MVAILNYGVGNVFSIGCSLNYIGVESVLTADPSIIIKAERMILPGVGAFSAAAALLHRSGLGSVLLEQVKKGKPLLGICLGMQLLYESSCEYGRHEGLGLVRGDIRSLAEDLNDNACKVPHMGWNVLEQRLDCPLMQHTAPGSAVYYVHSFYAPVTGDTVASSQYGDVHVTGIVRRGNVWGTQFHPEKSGDVGLAMLRAFCGV